MSDIEFVLAIAASAAAYMTGAGAVFRVLADAGLHGGDDPTAIFGAVFWPLVAFAMLGSRLARRVKGGNLPAARAVKR